MMTLDEAIKHAEEVAEENNKCAEHIRDKMKSEIALSNATECETCADEHRQLAKWLKDYKRLLEQEPKIGYWKTVPYEQTLFCSHCNLRLDDEQTYIPLHFCPNCGYIMESEKEHEQRKFVLDAIISGKLISDNATNGDMIMAIFPHAKVRNSYYTYAVEVKLEYHSQHDTGLLFDKKWWNAPYKAESEETDI